MRYILNAGTRYLKINGIKYPAGKLVVDDGSTDGIVKISTISGKGLASGLFESFLNGDDGNSTFTSLENLNTFLDSSFNIGGGDGFGVTSNVLTLAEYNAIVDKGSALYFIKA